MSQVHAIEEKKIDEVTREIALTVPQDEVDAARKTKLSKMRKTVRVDGFRAGHVPMRILEKMYGQSVLQEVAQDLCWQQWQKAIDSKSVHPVSQPDFAIQSLEAGKPIDFRVTYQVISEVALPDFSKIQIEKHVAKLTSADVDETIAAILANAVTWQQVERPSAHGDAVEVDMNYTVFPPVATTPEKPVEHSSKGEKLVLDKEKFTIPELLAHLVGVKTGAKVSCDVTFPDTFPNTQWRGRRAHFDIAIRNVLQAVFPELDKAFAVSAGISAEAADPVAEFRAQVEKNMHYELENAIEQQFRSRLFDGVVAKTTIHVPKSIADYYNALIRRDLAIKLYPPEHIQKMKESPETLLPAEQFVSQAEQRARVALLVGEVVRQKKIIVSDEMRDAEIDRQAVQYSDKQAFIKQVNENRNSLESFASLALERAVVKWISSQVKIKEIRKSYNDIIHPETKGEKKLSTRNVKDEKKTHNGRTDKQEK